MTAIALEFICLSSVQAQTVTADPSLGTQVNASFGRFSISGGSKQGVNLFHSFKTFSPGDWAARFDLTLRPSDSAIQRIFSRVTGGQSSIINGTLSIVGGNSPDLFLLNPNGILFGPDVQLNLGGSFIGTTANAIQFADGHNFSLAQPASSPILSISIPTGLQLGENPGEIRVVGNGHNIEQNRSFQWRSVEPISGTEGLTISPGNTLALVGGGVQFEGGQIQPHNGAPQTNSINSPRGTRLEIGAVSNGVVDLQPELRGWSLDYDGIQTFQDISLTNNSWLNSANLAPSDIQLRGQNITLDQGSSIFLVNLGDQPNGNLDVFASGLLKLQGSGPIASYLQNVALGPGRGGDTRVVSDRLQLMDGGAILTIAVGASGHAGAIDIDVTDTLQINGLSETTTSTANPTGIVNSTFGIGNVGVLEINARSIHLENGGLITSSTLGSGQGDVIRIEAEEQISLRGINPLSSINSNISAVSLSTGNASEELRVKTRRLEVLEGATISTDSLGSGNSGSVLIEATERIRVGGVDSTLVQLPAEISSAVLTEDLVATPLSNGEASGDSGAVFLQTPHLTIFDRGRITVSNQGSGQAGNLEIQAQTINLSDQAIIAATTQASSTTPAISQADGGGSIRLSAERALVLRDHSEISATARGDLGGGNILIETPQLIAVPQENSDITANAVSSFGGAIEIDAEAVLGLSTELRQTSRSDITASSERGPQFSGSVEFTQPQTRPNDRLAALPSRFQDQSKRLAPSCHGDSNQLSVTRRGSLAQADPDTQALSQQYGDRGHDYEQQQQWLLAEQNSIQALQLSQAAQNPLQSYQWAWQLARIAQARWEQTGDVRFRAEAKAYYQESLNALKVLRSDLAQQGQAAEFSFRTDIEPVYRQYVSLLLDAKLPQQSTQEELKISLQVIESLRLAELDNFFEDACSTATTQAIEQLDPTAAVLYPILLSDRLEVISSLPGGRLHRHSSPITLAQVQQLTQAFRRGLITHSRTNYREPGQQLYDLLIKPVVENLGQANVETLVFVPDRFLKNIPIAALWTGDSFFIEEFNVAIAPGLKLLDAQPSQTLASEAISVGISQQRGSFPPLRYVPQELAGIQSLISGESLLDEAFTKTEFQRLLLETTAPIVHIATHGQFSSTAAETFILAWDEQIDANQLSRLLRSREQSQVPTELLVLSACETASGDEAAALGLAGLSVRAGARSTLASLWSINDAFTASLMQEFYYQLSQKSASKSLALRQAQLAMLEDEIYSHPYYWSAFVLLGDWQ